MTNPAYDKLQVELKSSPRTWLVTGVAGFIGSNILEKLLSLDQHVVGLDNFETGFKRNFDEVKSLVTAKQWKQFNFIEGDICKPDDCRRACEGVNYILHQAALGSVPRSIAAPMETVRTNINGFLDMLLSSRDAGVKRFIYASSCAVYGDHPGLPKVEEKIGRQLSPYAATKAMNEICADTFARTYSLETIGLRYFNVFGVRQDPDGAYAAVIPKWTASLMRREPIHINGDGETSRDFCFVENIVQSNLLAAATTNPEALNQVYNIGVGMRTTLNELFNLLAENIRRKDPKLPETRPIYREFRAGDVRHSLADITKAQRLLNYQPTHTVERGLEVAMDWYREHVV